MPACHAPHVFAEEIDSGQRCTQAVTSDPLWTLFKTWCTHELQWVVYETNFLLQGADGVAVLSLK
jgi:hypothetical protein